MRRPGTSPLSMQVERSRRLTRTLSVMMDYSGEVPVDDIADKYEMSRTTVLRIARTANLPKRRKGFAPEVKEGVLAMYLDKKPLAEIMARFNVSAGYISTAARDAGLPLRKPQKPKGAAE